MTEVYLMGSFVLPWLAIRGWKPRTMRAHKVRLWVSALLLLAMYAVGAIVFGAGMLVYVLCRERDEKTKMQRRQFADVVSAEQRVENVFGCFSGSVYPLAVLYPLVGVDGRLKFDYLGLTDENLHIVLQAWVDNAVGPVEYGGNIVGRSFCIMEDRDSAAELYYRIVG